MSDQSDTVTINGRQYDKKTGMPINAATTEATKVRAESFSHSKIHGRTQKSQTLSRKYVKQPIASRQTSPAAPVKKSQATELPKITKFAAHPVTRKAKSMDSIRQPAKPTATKLTPNAKFINDFGPTIHPMVQKVHSAASQKVETVAKPAAIVKNEAIEKALANATEPQEHKRNRAKNHSSKSNKRSIGKILSIASGGLAVLLVGAYFTYISMPSISVKVAASQAGVNASYPAYQPSGFSLSGPVAYDRGSVRLTFAQNGGPQKFTLTQSTSGWDSDALLENFVTPKAGQDYNTTQTSGLTIYTFDDEAAWVSGGILYTIAGDKQLTSDQVQRIATSL